MFISEKSNSDLKPNSSNLGPPIPYKFISEFFLISFINPAPSLSPECSPQTIPMFKALFVDTYLKIPLSEISTDLIKIYKQGSFLLLFRSFILLIACSIFNFFM